MLRFLPLLLFWLIVLGSGSAGAASKVEDFSPHFPTNTAIVWNAATTNLPRTVRSFKMILPHVFPDATISTAIAIAPLPNKNFKWSAKKQFCLDLDTCPCGHACTFGIFPATANLSYSSPSFRNGSPDNIPEDKTLIKRAEALATQLGLDAAQLSRKQITTNHCEYDLKGRQVENNVCGHGITLSRRIDNIDFFGDDLVEGFYLELGRDGEIRFFSLTWPDLLPLESVPTTTPAQIIACIRAFKTILIPPKEPTNYFSLLKALSKAKRVTFTKLTPRYSEGTYGDVPKEGSPLPNVVTPIAELEAIAEFDDGSFPIRLCSPLASPDAIRLLHP